MMLALLHPDEDRRGHRQVHLEDLTFVIDLTLMVAFASAIYLLKQRHITLATLAHTLSVVFLVFTVGHYAEKHLVGLDHVEDLVRRGPNQRVIKDWLWAGVQSTTAFGAIGGLLGWSIERRNLAPSLFSDEGFSRH